jgi:hypothetical protein
MPLSRVQKGAVGQFAFLTTALVTSKGQVEVYAPSADNEGRDAEIRRHLKPAPPIGLQIKVSFSITLHHGDKYLEVRFFLLEKRIQSDPRLWYFFACYDTRGLRFHGPVFLIPANIFHRLGRTGTGSGHVWFRLMASLEPKSRDRWSPYRVTPSRLGRRLLEIIDEAPLADSNLGLQLPPGSVLIGSARRPVARANVRRAARAA